MLASDTKSLPSIGFLTIRKYDDLGRIGGYLVLNTAGRPLEFHCTAPVRPNRAQEILYGPTLEPFLCAEQIGRALTAKGKSQPMFICTDVEPVLALREHISLPVVFLQGTRVDPPHTMPAGHSPTFGLGGHVAMVSKGAAADRQEITRQWEGTDQGFDLLEPFSRLRDAIDETQGGVGR